MLRPLHMAHRFLEEVLTPEDVAVDATMGNGHDTLFLAQRAGHVIAFDIQEQAITKTSKKIEDAGLANVELILEGHEKVDRYVKECKVAIFNLGYLPSSDKSLITRPSTTLEAIEKLLSSMVVGGRMAIMVYYGHEGGAVEKDAVLEFVETLEQTMFAVMLYKPLNQIHTPPFLIMIEKLKEG